MFERLPRSPQHPLEAVDSCKKKTLNSMKINTLSDFVSRSAPPEQRDGVPFELGQPDLYGVRSLDKTPPEQALYKPMIALVLQGRKLVWSGTHEMSFEAGRMIVISQETPVTARIIEASGTRPFLALLFFIDIARVRSIDARLQALPKDTSPFANVSEHLTRTRLYEALAHYVDASTTESGKAILIEGIRDEVHLRLLESPYGAMVREMAKTCKHSDGILKSIEFINDHFSGSISVDDLAKSAGMGVSAYFKHFKSYTGVSPKRYLKELRLRQAHFFITAQQKSVSSAAYQSGYRSLSQFSRDFKAFFGCLPSEAGGSDGQ